MQALSVTRSLSLVQDSYTFNGRWGKIGRWIFNLLSKPQCERKIDVVTIDVDDAVSAIRQSVRACELAYNRELEMVVVGPDVFNKLRMSLPPMNFNVDNNMTVCGVPVRMVPWFEGLLCIPKER